MPSASPLPRGPSVLVLGQPDELITRPGCPACRYVAEASDRYLTWFALEGHGEASVITRLSASLGMCSAHTRALLSQPGAAVRLTAVYQYVLRALPGQLASRRWRPDDCMACQQAMAAAGRVLSMVGDGLTDAGFRSGFQEAGGLCVPHLSGALRRCGRDAASWLAGVTLTRLQQEPVSVELLAGGPDPDADVRARLRATLSRTHSGLPAGRCPVCHAALRADQAQLELAARPPFPALCAPHLRDALLVADPPPDGILTAAGARHAGYLFPIQASRRWSRRRAQVAAGCAACRGRAEAERRELRSCAAAADSWSQLCVRHVLGLRSADASAGRQAAAIAAARAAVLQAELAEAFRKQTWAGRQETRGTEMTAWQRAAAFLDGTADDGAE